MQRQTGRRRLTETRICPGVGNGCGGPAKAAADCFALEMCDEIYMPRERRGWNWFDACRRPSCWKAGKMMMLDDPAAFTRTEAREKFCQMRAISMKQTS